ncbi:uncharacterized protein [Notamacropus eugenii]|uniref:uncharacterized protein isoform X1 n=1 Tax=Notamacropus eugenii TaxID=9315 RepID=UPI003B6805A8
MPRKGKRNKTIEGYFLGEKTLPPFLSDEEEQCLPSGKDTEIKDSVSQPTQWAQAMEELKKNFENQVREAEEKLGREMRGMKEKHEKQISSLLKNNQKNDEEINTLKTSLTQLAKEVQKANEEKNAFKNRISQMEKEIQKLTEENRSFKTGMVQMDAKDFMRKTDITEHSEKIGKMEDNVKYLIGKTTDLENRIRRDNVKILGLPENHDQKKSLDIIFHEIIKENCPEILEPEGKINIQGIRRTPHERDPKRETPRNIVAKFQNSQVKEKILQAARKKQFKYCGNTIRITQDLAPSTLRDRREWNKIFQKSKELGLKPRITYPAKLSIILQEKKWSFNEIEDFQIFLMKRPELERKFDFLTQE